LAGVVLCWFGLLISLPANAVSDVPGVSSAPAGADGGSGGPNAPPPDANYPLTLAEEVWEGVGHPVNANHLTMIVLVLASSGVSVLWLLTMKSLRRGAIRSWGVVVEDGRWLTTASEGLSFLGVFRL
jgi:hypothetical protein